MKVSSCPWSPVPPTNTRSRLGCTPRLSDLLTNFWLLNLLDSSEQKEKADDAEHENGTSL